MKRFTFVAFTLMAAVASWSAQGAQGLVDVLDQHKLPLGDGKVSTTPQRGYVFSCTTTFGGAGAQAEGPWIHGTTWDLTQKFAVHGRVMWPQATFKISIDGTDRIVSRIIQGNGLPMHVPTGIFPVTKDDPAYKIDSNPNSIKPHEIALKLPMNPEFGTKPSCVSMGMIAVALNGVAIFNALDGGGRDAVAHEMQDVCDGHPQPQGHYHYHGPSPCMPGETNKEQLIGYALDGFGIYSLYDVQGRELTDADLDECHGRTSEVEWNGKRQKIYHYALTREYPYTIGCYRGTPVQTGDE